VRQLERQRCQGFGRCAQARWVSSMPRSPSLAPQALSGSPNLQPLVYDGVRGASGREMADFLEPVLELPAMGNTVSLSISSAL
jgi:hypothetical protein